VIGVIVVRTLEEADVPSAVGVVARGMCDNPLHIAALGADARLRARRLTRLFTVALPLIFSKGVIFGAFDGDTLAGIAGMIAPGHCQPSVTEKLVVVPRLVPRVGSGALARVGRWMNAWAEQDLPEPHWHLGPVAVDAHLQRNGIGTLLMTESCARLDGLCATGYLETDKASNVTFYERFGFETISSAPVLETANWFMRREPR
jgi:ribosomal protein S18 acetylase RimI-like enzyme